MEMDYSCDIYYVDSDDNIEELIPLWLKSKINYVWSLERATGNDAIALRKKYGRADTGWRYRQAGTNQGVLIRQCFENYVNYIYNPKILWLHVIIRDF